MNNTNQKYKLYVFITLALTALSVVLRTLLLFKYFDTDVNYYSTGTLLPFLHTALSCAAVVFMLSVVFTFKKDELDLKKFQNSAIFIFSSALCGFTLLSNFVVSLVKRDTSKLGWALMICTAIASAYFISMLIPAKNDSIKKVQSALSLFVPIWGTIGLAQIYFAPDIAINNPNKLIEQLAFISVMLFFLFECRVHIGEQKTRGYFFTGLAAMFFTATAAIPGILVFPFDKIGKSFIMYDIIFASMFIYVCTRMLSCEKSNGGVTFVCI